MLVFYLVSPVDDYVNYSSREEKSFYEFTECVDAIDSNLSKALVSNDDGYLQGVLNDIRLNGALASENLANLSLRDEEKFYTAKFINQVSDFTNYLSKKLSYNQKLSSSDYETLNAIYEI